MFAHMKYGIRSSLTGWLRVRGLKNEFTEDEKYHNLMNWLNYSRNESHAISQIIPYKCVYSEYNL